MVESTGVDPAQVSVQLGGGHLGIRVSGVGDCHTGHTLPGRLRD